MRKESFFHLSSHDTATIIPCLLGGCVVLVENVSYPLSLSLSLSLANSINHNRECYLSPASPEMIVLAPLGRTTKCTKLNKTFNHIHTHAQTHEHTRFHATQQTTTHTHSTQVHIYSFCVHPHLFFSHCTD